MTGLHRHHHLSSSNQSSPRGYGSPSIPDHPFITPIHTDDYRHADADPEKTVSKLLQLGRKFRHILPPSQAPFQTPLTQEVYIPQYRKMKTDVNYFGPSYQWIGICKYRTKLPYRGKDLDRMVERYKRKGPRLKPNDSDQEPSITESDSEVESILSGSKLLDEAAKIFTTDWWQFKPNKAKLEQAFQRHQLSQVAPLSPTSSLQNGLELHGSDEELDSPIPVITKPVPKTTPLMSPGRKVNGFLSDSPVNPPEPTATLMRDVIEKRPPSMLSDATDTSHATNNSNAASVTNTAKPSKKSPDKRKIEEIKEEEDIQIPKKAKLEKIPSAEKPKNSKFNVGRLMRIERYNFPDIEKNKGRNGKKKEKKKAKKRKLVREFH